MEGDKQQTSNVPSPSRKNWESTADVPPTALCCCPTLTLDVPGQFRWRPFTGTSHIRSDGGDHFQRSSAACRS
eukprot:3951369-Prymnesium_polylepis.1